MSTKTLSDHAIVVHLADAMDALADLDAAAELGHQTFASNRFAARKELDAAIEAFEAISDRVDSLDIFEIRNAASR